MKTCTKCNKELNEGSKFCEDCGTPVEETVFCTNCGKEMSKQATFCQNCGEKIVAKDFEDVYSQEKPRKKAPKKLILTFGVIAVIAVAVIAIVMLSKNNGIIKSSPFSLYLKDDEIFFSDLKEDSASWQLTNDFFDELKTEEGADWYDYDSEWSAVFSVFASQMKKSKDGSLLFYADRVEFADDNTSFLSYSLYYRNITKDDFEPIKIDSDVRDYVINESSTIITYFKGEEGSLYQYAIEDDMKEKIDDNIGEYYVSSNGEKIYYITLDGDIYIKEMGKDKEKIAGEAENLTCCSNSFETVFYTKNDALYRKTEGEDKEKIASDIDGTVLVPYAKDAVYYTKSNSKEVSGMDFVEDDMKEKDESFVAPVKPVSPSWWDYETDEEYSAAYDRYLEEYKLYEAQSEAYNEKLHRDQIREELEELNYTDTRRSLYYYNGTEEILVSEDFSGYLANAADKPVFVYLTNNKKDAKKIKLSDIEDTSDVDNEIWDILYPDEQTMNVAVNEKVFVTDNETDTPYSAYVNGDGTIIYFVADVDEGINGDLYRINIENGQVSQAEKYDSDVLCVSGLNTFITNEKFLYYKDCNSVITNADMYVNGEKIAYDVSMKGAGYNDKTDNLYYLKDWNEDKQYGTLELYHDGETTKIADDVYSYCINSDGSISYLYDYSLDYDNGELRLWKNGENRKIDDDVELVFGASEEYYSSGFAYSGDRFNLAG